MSPAEIFDLLTSNETPDFKIALKTFLIACIGAVLMIVWFTFLQIHSSLTF